MNKSKYENKELCTSCGGKCCKRMGCELFPEDVIKQYGAISKDSIRSLLDTGDFSIDWYGNFSEKWYRGFYIRARHIYAPKVDPSYGGRCVALTDTGCKFDFEHRPSGGKYLIPSVTNCVSNYNKKTIATMWEPYFCILQDIVRELEEELGEDHDMLHSFFEEIMSSYF